MKSKIIDYLTLKYSQDKNRNFANGRLIKEAFLLAKKDFNKMTESEKEKIIKIINNDKS